ncbi:MAG: nucleotidyltransferase domain-containing protein [bacterium]
MDNNTIIKVIVERIINSVDPEKIILFGSYAYGSPDKNSDLDLLVVIKQSNQPRYKRARAIRKHLWDITDLPKDIVVYTEDEIDDWRNVKQAFTTTIVEKGKVLYEKVARTENMYTKPRGENK